MRTYLECALESHLSQASIVDVHVWRGWLQPRMVNADELRRKAEHLELSRRIRAWRLKDLQGDQTELLSIPPNIARDAANKCEVSFGWRAVKAHPLPILLIDTDDDAEARDLEMNRAD